MSLPANIPGTLWRHKQTGGFYWYVALPGERKRRARPVVVPPDRYATKVKRLAIARVRILWTQITQGGAKVAPRGMERWITDFQGWNAVTATERQARFYADVARKFINKQSILHPWEIGPEAVQEYLQGLDLSPQTLTHHRNGLSRFCEYLMARNQLETNPARHPLVVVPIIRRGLPRYLTIRQQWLTLWHLRESYPDLYVPVLFCLSTGARLNEMAAVVWSDLREGGVRLHSLKAAHDEAERIIPVTPRLRRALDRCRADRVSIFPRRGSRRWCRMMKEATDPLPVFGELPGRRAGNQWHLLRSTWAVNQARRGVGLWELMRLGGWSCPQTVMRYVNLAGAVVARNRP